MLYKISGTKGENTGNVVISTNIQYLNEKTTLKGLDKSHKIGKSDPAKMKQRPVILKFARWTVCYKVFINKGKLKGIENRISENLN